MKLTDTTTYWFYMRASYGRARKALDILTDMGVKAYLPVEHKKVREEESGRLKKIESYPLPSNIFICCTYKEAYELTSRSLSDHYVEFLDFAFDHTCIDSSTGKNPVITIPNQVMERFIQVTDIDHPGAHFVKPDEVFTPGAKVRVIGGPFEGAVGNVAHLYGKKRVVVSIPGIISYATAYINSQYLEVID